MVKVVFSREVREPYKDENAKNRYSINYQDMEFIFTKKFSKMLSQVFSEN